MGSAERGGEQKKLDKWLRMWYIGGMPATINPIRKAILKKALLNPKNSIKDSLLLAGYARSTAEGKNSATGAVKVCQEEIARELVFSDLTPQHFTRRSELIFHKSIDRKKPDLTNAIRITEFQGRISGIDRQSPSTIVNISDGETTIINADTDGLTRLARGRQ